MHTCYNIYFKLQQNVLKLYQTLQNSTKPHKTLHNFTKHNTTLCFQHFCNTIQKQDFYNFLQQNKNLPKLVQYSTKRYTSLHNYIQMQIYVYKKLYKTLQFYKGLQHFTIFQIIQYLIISHRTLHKFTKLC
jgi:hypothetical protein